MHRNYLYKYLTTADSPPVKIANGDYSVTPGVFTYTNPDDGKYAHISQLLIHIHDENAGFTAENYGGVATLANGVEVGLYDAEGNLVYDLLDGTPITGAAEWARVADSAVPHVIGSGDNFWQIRWVFPNHGAAIILEALESLRVTCNDDLTGLVDHVFFINGYRYRP